MQNRSHYDPSRKTVGAIYRDAQMGQHDSHVTNGDLTNVMLSSLVEDLNETIHEGSKQFKNRPFYITVHEKKDLQMPRALLRRMIKTEYRPYPEDDTLVFYVNPKTNDVRFCWCLPHSSEMDNMLHNESLYNEEMIRHIKSWKSLDLQCFGFRKDEKLGWQPLPQLNDRPMKESHFQIVKG